MVQGLLGIRDTKLKYPAALIDRPEQGRRVFIGLIRPQAKHYAPGKEAWNTGNVLLSEVSVRVAVGPFDIHAGIRTEFVG